MINILFVDDEPNILSGLQRMLRPMRDEWHMIFAGGGQEALGVLGDQQVDVIVSDMKMPGIDGAKLLNEVRVTYPHIIRIILSGYSERETIMRSVGTTHQYLSKPCDPELLKLTVKRVCSLRNLLEDEKLRTLVSKMPNVPSLPTLYSDLMEELRKDDSSTRNVGLIVKKDIGMTVKILQIVNSAFFGLKRRVTDSTQAVEFLGLETISSLTLGLGIISQLKGNRSITDQLSRLWEHSVAVGIMASKIAKMENPAVAGDAFTAGLLHDIGEIVLAMNLPDEFEEAQALAKSERIPCWEAEKRVFKATHAEVGAYLIGLWGLPAQVVEAVAFHHNPREAPIEGFTALTAVHIANALHRQQSAAVENDDRVFYDKEYLGELNLLDKLPVYLDKSDLSSNN